ncbi:malto-oligosyltrehalose trehalohydrolase [Segetibacter sp. 3557_3]|uniref:malto-oligosyltrehalose trehalohydrolase n=1 Tax=Segetibacter sp. 3557_3 TaxID=2547429 RepID=UPI00105902D3|nr:malto-oligosyltrehalose trehalohydrolase [Segetibacter sp. 3557_3]TDH21563.1 malto-oligosyltrehalose trehalohydrolase [Segetibacter sp. 3557_3]
MKTTLIEPRKIGVNFIETGEAHIQVWSPLSGSVELILQRNDTHLALSRSHEGYWTLTTAEVRPGDRYYFSLDGKAPLPDPASLSQPEGVYGASEAVHPGTYDWSDNTWQNPDLSSYIFYELHTGTFSQAGNFNGIEDQLDYLVDLGITAIEIMPVAQFPGDRNWGYDGVFPFAVQDSYGGVNGLQKLVDACHAKGIAVVLDVVYNHLGPEGNYLGEYGPYFTDKYKTPWGKALNFDDAWCDGVREYFLENALMWFRDFHIDALRLDAVHAIKDFSAVHILNELRQRVDELMAATGRKHYLIVELDLNDTRFINPGDQGGFGMDGQWVDEFHHALRVTAGEPRSGYYEDFNGIAHLAKAYRDAYVYDGQFSEHRKKKFGIKAEHNAGQQFVVFSQNHDQVGNRMLGERTSTLLSFELQKLLAGAVLLSPYLPMLFMGEEFSEPNPFLYFISHTNPDLVEAVRKGRKAEFAAFHLKGEAPDPASVNTFQQSKLQWSLLGQEPHKTMFRFYKALIQLRKSQPLLYNLNREGVEAKEDTKTQIIILHRRNSNHDLVCCMNFSGRQQQIELPIKPGTRANLVFNSADAEWGGPGAAGQTKSNGDSGQLDVLLQPESFIIYVTN